METLTNAPPLCVGSVGRPEPADGVRCGGMPRGPVVVRSGEASKGTTEERAALFVDKRDVPRDNEGSVSVGGPNRRTPGFTINIENDLFKYNNTHLNCKRTFSLYIRSSWCLHNTSTGVDQWRGSRVLEL